MAQVRTVTASLDRMGHLARSIFASRGFGRGLRKDRYFKRDISYQDTKTCRSRPLQRLVDWQANLEARVPGNRGEGDGTAHLADQAVNRIEPESGAVAYPFGGEERLED